jgi:MoaA/NifB/PqqE/SkfB family radical SAM enzyme
MDRTLAILRRHGVEMIRQRFGGRPRVLEIEVTRACDARCAWCQAWRAPGNEPEMPDYAAMVRRIAPLDVALVGGEPLLRPDLDHVVSSLRLSTEVSSISLLTTGARLDIDRACRLCDAGVDKLIVAVEGFGEENDRARRLPGLWDTIDRVLSRIGEAGFRAVQIQVSITARNLLQANDLIGYALGRGVRIAFSLDTPARLEARSFPEDEEALSAMDAALDAVAESAERWPHVVTSSEYLRGVVPFLRHQPVPAGPCNSGVSFLRASPDGWIRPCASQPPLGHWTAFPFRVRPIDCGGCWSRLRGETQSGLGVTRLVEMYRSTSAR